MHSISSSGSRALALLAAVLLTALLAGACSSDGDETTEADATTTTTAIEEPSEAPTSAPDESLDPEEFPTIDVEAALEGVDTETPPDPRFCEISGIINGPEFEAVLLAALGGDEEARAQFDELFEEFESVAPEGLEDDVAALEAALALTIDVYVEAGPNGEVDQTQLLEDRAEIIGDSAARLGAYDQVVCGNAVPGEPLS